jgi:hypothetical protein
MSCAGRFIACVDCHLSIEFPTGKHYDTIAKEIESHVCSGILSMPVSNNSPGADYFSPAVAVLK